MTPCVTPAARQVIWHVIAQVQDLPGHIARECTNEPVCNLCNVSGHLARNCQKTTISSEIQGGPFRDITCRLCGKPGHISRNCMTTMICGTCGGRGHMSYECPSARMFDRGLRRF
ncbi:hypothetical protein OsJ_13140 [Oryza sativa Japonica Group]|uniref:CCHC-type domain-containing protein n=1 Tax=Oryza sativa subsp. japonica TaxID=39947 RepID=A3AP47_ORYSJ|nr:hypothetical protein OsJ_13140 [Oryza sativa Japonica Group]